MKLYRRVERLLRSRTGSGRRRGQTVSAYAAEASVGDPTLHGQLAWFTRTMWRAAYDPRELPEGLLIETLARMVQLKAAMKAPGMNNS